MNEIIKEILVFYNEVAIYLLFGFFIAAILHIFFSESFIKYHLGKKTFKSVLKSTLLGIPLPVCSCGVIPIAASINNSGASKGSTVSFLLATPQIGADSFLITYSLLGCVFALFRITASLISALIAGLFINIIDKNEINQQDQNIVFDDDKNITDRTKNIFYYIEYELLGPIAGSLIIGLIIAGVISIVFSDNFFEVYLGNEFFSMIIMLIAGIPMYVCASASTPIAASLILKGMSPGAALIFLLTGPATNAVNISAVSNMLGKKATITYLTIISIISLILGYFLNLLTSKFGIMQIIAIHHHDLLPQCLKITGSGIIALMLVWYYIDVKILSNKKNDNCNSEEQTNNTSMCMHCCEQ